MYEIFNNYIENLSKIMNEMFELSFKPSLDYKDSEKNKLDMLSSRYYYWVNVPFSGKLSGDFFVACDKDEWRNILSKTAESDKEFNDLMKEFLNTVCGKTLKFLLNEEATLSVPRIFEGNIEYPLIDILGAKLVHVEYKPIEAFLCIDLMKHDIHRKLDLTTNKLQLEAEKAKKAEVQNKLKSQFISRISHDLRTPLHIIIGVADLLLNKEDVEEYIKKSITMIRSSGSRLLDLVNDILDLSRVESGKLELSNEVFALDHILKNFNMTMKTLLQDRNIKFIEEIEVDKGRLFYTDKKKLVYIIINLLANAVKFTEQGEIKLRIYVKEDKLYLKILDTGIGIRAEYLDKIFDPYIQASDVVDKKYQSTGLGLAICKQYLGIIKGGISVESEVNKGAVFTVWVPLLTIPEDEIPDKEFKDSIAKPINNELLGKLKTKKILFCDDDEFNRDFLRMIFTDKIDYKVVPSGKEAIKAINREEFDLVFMDIMLDDMSGLDVMKEIKKQNKNTQVIAFTAIVMKNEIKDIIDEGFDDYFSKPFTKTQILNFIKKHLKL
ncbi:response regulator [Candidatus Margulisiibacteriota bacterium]